MRSSILCVAALVAILPAGVTAAQSGGTASVKFSSIEPRIPAAMSAIREADLKRDLYKMAGLDMRGREAGTLDELRASVWVADQLRAIGVKPAGTDGSYFQWWNMQRTRVSTISSSAKIGSHTLALWTDIIPNFNTLSDASGVTVWAGDGQDSTLDVRGKVVIALMQKMHFTP